MNMTKIDETEKFPTRYSSVAYFSVFAMDDEDYEIICKAIAQALASFDFVRVESVGEV
jgi:hypothetical protein